MHRWGRSLVRVVVAAVSCAVLSASVTPASAGGDPRIGEQWGLSLIRAPEAWGAGTGAGITIAVVDTGVDFGHEDLNVGGKLLPGHNVLDPTKPAQDDNGHGTHVAGIAAAATGNSLGVAGTAPSASILPVKVLRADGSGYARDVATGIRWAAGEGSDPPRAQVINLSLGSDLPPLAALFGSGLEEAIDYAWSRGVVVVLAAGNSFPFESSAGQTPAIVVTATNRQDERPSYASAVGSAKWGMAAPGGSSNDNPGGIMSTYRPNAYRFLAGTSMAAPYVAGVAAVLRAKGLSPQQTVDRLLATAKDLGPAGRDSTFGAGRLDMACAVGRCGSASVSTATSTPAGSAPADGGGAASGAAGGSDAGGPGAGSGTDSGASGAAPAAGTSGGGGASASGAKAGTPGSSTTRSGASGARIGGRPGAAGTATTAAPGQAPVTEEVAPGVPGAPPASSDVGSDPDEIRLSFIPPDDESRSEENGPSVALVATAAALLVALCAYGWRRRPR